MILFVKNPDLDGEKYKTNDKLNSPKPINAQFQTLFKELSPLPTNYLAH